MRVDFVKQHTLDCLRVLHTCIQCFSGPTKNFAAQITTALTTSLMHHSDNEIADVRPKHITSFLH